MSTPRMWAHIPGVTYPGAKRGPKLMGAIPVKEQQLRDRIARREARAMARERREARELARKEKNAVRCAEILAARKVAVAAAVRQLMAIGDGLRALGVSRFDIRRAVVAANLGTKQPKGGTV